VKPAPEPGTPAAQAPQRRRAADFFELTKPRITVLVLVTTLVGFYFGIDRLLSLLLVHTLAGTALVAAGASAFNMYLERSLDALMQRTRRRPLPAGRLQPGEALVFAVVISTAGMVYLYLLVNPLTSLLSAITFISYIFLYTPLKTRTWLCTLIGAIPGALPVAMGWAAAAGTLSAKAWILFGIVFLWQLPHFYAIGWMYRDDYAVAGFPMLPVLDATGGRTSRQASLYILGLIGISSLPSFTGMAGLVYLGGAMILGAFFLWFGIRFAQARDRVSARTLFFASIAYLPAVLVLMMVDKR
jgi:protoheme IX farnesyltransferase